MSYMPKQTIREILEEHPEYKMRQLPGVLTALQINNAQSRITAKMTTTEALKLLNANDPGLIDQPLVRLLQPRTGKGRLHECKTMAMWISLILMLLSFATVNVYNAYRSGQLLPWEEIMFLIAGPMILVFHDRGLSFKENRDLLSAIAGSTPAMTIFEAMSKRIANGPTKYTVPKEKEAETKPSPKKKAPEDY